MDLFDTFFGELLMTFLIAMVPVLSCAVQFRPV